MIGDQEMKHSISIILYLILTLVLGCFVFHSINKLTPTIQNGSVFPSDIEKRSYAISGLEKEQLNNEFRISFLLESDMPACSLVIKNLVPYDINQTSDVNVFQDDKLIYKWSENSPYSRIQFIPLVPLDKGQTLTIRFVSDLFSVPLIEHPNPFCFILGFARSLPQVMIAGEDFLTSILNTSEFINAIIIGIYFALIIYSSSLWIKARSQHYLLLMSASSIIALLSTSLVYFSSGLIISYHLYTILFQILSCITSILSGLFCVVLYYDVWNINKPSWKKTIAASCIIIIIFIVFHILNIRFYVFLRRLLWIPVIFTFYKAIKEDEFGAKLLSFAYIFTEVILFLMYASNELPPATTDIIKMHFRLTDALYLIFLLFLGFN